MKIGVVSGLHNPAEPPFLGGIEASSWYLAELLRNKYEDVFLFSTGTKAPEGVQIMSLPAYKNEAKYELEDEHVKNIFDWCATKKIDVLLNLSNIASFIVANILGYGPPQIFWLQLGPYGYEPFTQTLSKYFGLPLNRQRRRALFQTFTQKSEYLKYSDSFMTSLTTSSCLPMPLGKDCWESSGYPMYPIKKDAPYVLWAGRPVFEKGFTDFIELAEISEKYKSEAQFLLFATEETETLRIWREQERTKKLKNLHIFSQNIDRQTYFELLREKIDVAVMPTHSYTRKGTPVIEAGSRFLGECQMHGIPVLAYNHGCAKDWITHGKNGFLQEEDSDFYTPHMYANLRDALELNISDRLNIQSTARERYDSVRLEMNLDFMLASIL